MQRPRSHTHHPPKARASSRLWGLWLHTDWQAAPGELDQAELCGQAQREHDKSKPNLTLSSPPRRARALYSAGQPPRASVARKAPSRPGASRQPAMACRRSVSSGAVAVREAAPAAAPAARWRQGEASYARRAWARRASCPCLSSSFHICHCSW